MPNHGKGGRKPERGEAKRSSVAVRTTSEIKAALEAAAKENERSVTQEVEERLAASLALDRPKTSSFTMRLLADIAADIEAAEALTGKGWHADLVTWAMVREALATGAIERKCPEKFFQGEGGNIPNEAEEARERILALGTEQAELEAVLNHLGFHSAPKPGSLGALMQRDTAEASREKLEQLSPELRGIIEPILEKVVALKAEREKVMAEYLQSFEWVKDAINKGVQRWHAEQASKGIRVVTEFRPEMARPLFAQLIEPRAVLETLPAD